VVAVKTVDSLALAPRLLDELHTATRTPLTARMRWWLAVMRSNGHGMPILFTAESRNGSLAAAGLLFHTGRRLVSPRLGSDDVWTIAARTPAALRNVAAQIAEAATGLHLQITGLRDGDPAIEALAVELSDFRIVPAEPVPKIDLAPPRDRPADARMLVRRDVHRQLKKSDRQLSAANARPRVVFERDPARLLALRDSIRTIHSDRDHAARRSSDLDTLQGAEFWDAVYVSHALSGELELALLYLGDRLAAYVAGLVDRLTGSYGLWDGRMSPGYEEYAPGHRLETAVLQRVLADPSLSQLDWMSSVVPEKLIAATGAQKRWSLVSGEE
jgi:hypothetical protein